MILYVRLVSMTVYVLHIIHTYIHVSMIAYVRHVLQVQVQRHRHNQCRNHLLKHLTCMCKAVASAYGGLGVLYLLLYSML